MPTRKQRRRREKDRRHEYEYVYVDEEGHEVESPEGEAKPDRDGKKPQPARTRSGRAIEPPSWNRIGKRALIFAPLMFLVIRLLEKGEPIQNSVARTLFLLAVFLPFSYVMDSMLYRSYQKRIERSKRSN